MDGGIVAARALNHRPDRYGSFTTSDESLPSIPRGAGFSFAAASFGSNEVSINLTAFDRILDFDGRTGHVEVEAGVTLGTLFQFLAPRGYYLPVQPGHHAITVGGCIAADVHGKNPARDGTFISQVDSVRLFHPRQGCIELSCRQEPDLFRATCGGLGLTGVILSARLTPKPLPSDTMQFSHRYVATALEGAATLRENFAQCDLAYAWLDFSRRRRSFGRGVATTGVFLLQPRTPTSLNLRRSRFSAISRARLPVSLISAGSVRALNMAYCLGLKNSSGIVHIGKALYPTRLNELYLSLFGRPGLCEYQAIIPAKQFDEYINFIHDGVSRHSLCVALAVAKPFCGTSDFIRFTGDGISLAIELPRNAGTLSFLKVLDRLMVKLGGRPNIIKDSRLPRAVFDATYAESDRFRRTIRAWDPDRIFRSEVSLRLGL